MHPPPRYRDRFVGRGEELRALGAALDAGARLITVHGPGGIGKTRLVLHLAHQRRRVLRAIAFCDVARARSASAVREVVAGALDVPVDAIGRALRHARVAVLDNVDGVVGAVAALVASWQVEAPHTQIVCTSRQPLGVPGEHLVALGAHAEAAELFSARASEHGVDLGPADQARVDQVVARLERIPLALELAASRLEVLGLGELAERLADRFGVLREPGRSGRHGALWDTVAWSWDLLDDDERAVLSQASVFVGGIPIDAAGAVIHRGDVGAVLAGLVQKSLVRQVGPDRYVLDDTTREFAAAMLDQAGETDRTAARHAAWYAARGKEWHAGRSRIEVRQRLAAEQHDLAAAVDRAADPEAAMWASLALHPIYVQGRDWTGYLERLDAVMAPLQGTRSEALSHALEFQGGVLRHLTRTGEAKAAFERALAIAEQRGDVAAMARALERLGEVAGYLGAPEAADLHARALALARQAGDTRTEARILMTSAVQLQQRHGHFDEALAMLTRSADLASRSGEDVWLGIVLHTLGSVYLDGNRYEEATAAFAEALALLERANELRQASAAREGLALVYHLQGDLSSARAAYDVIIADRDRLADDYFLYVYVGYLGLVALEEGDARGALVHADRSAAGLASDPRYAASVFESLARLWGVAAAAASGDLDQARARLTPALERLAAQPDARVRPLAALARGMIDAGDAVSAALAGDDDGARKLAARASQHRAALRGELGLFDVAVRVLDQALEPARRAAWGWLVSADGTWFRDPDGVRVDLSRKPVLARLLAALSEGPQATGALAQRVWRDDPDPDVVANRLYVSARALRKLGLASLVNRQGAYLLDPEPLRLS